MRSGGTANELGWTKIEPSPPRDKRFKINDEHINTCKRSLARSKRFNLFDVDGVSRVGGKRASMPRCKCGGHLVVSVADNVKL